MHVSETFVFQNIKDNICKKQNNQKHIVLSNKLPKMLDVSNVIQKRIQMTWPKNKILGDLVNGFNKHFSSKRLELLVFSCVRLYRDI